MELPFAVDASVISSMQVGESSSNASSLVTASSQGSFAPMSEHEHDHDHNLHLRQHEELFHDAIPTEATYKEQPSNTTSQQDPRDGTFVPSMNSSTSTSTLVGTSIAGEALKAAGSRVSSVLSNFGFINRSIHSIDNSTEIPRKVQRQNLKNHHPEIQDNNTDVIEFAYDYINVIDEDEVDIWLDDHNNTAKYSNSINDASDPEEDMGRTDILAVLIHQQELGRLVEYTESANMVAADAEEAKAQGNLQEALDRHTEAAKLFHEAALIVQERDGERRLNSSIDCSRFLSKCHKSLTTFHISFQ